MRRITIAALAAALVGAVAAIGASASPARVEAKTVRVQLMDFMVMPSTARAPAGKVTFVVKNVGKAKHNFVVLRTKLAPSKLPMAGQKAKAVGLVGRTPVFGPGQTRRLTLTLRPGRYLLICNVAGHYMAGMRAAFRVG
jgi:uncharacterized cupredoxin-like copper-binding protein